MNPSDQKIIILSYSESFQCGGGGGRSDPNLVSFTCCMCVEVVNKISSLFQCFHILCSNEHLSHLKEYKQFAASITSGVLAIKSMVVPLNSLDLTNFSMLCSSSNFPIPLPLCDHHQPVSPEGKRLKIVSLKN